MVNRSNFLEKHILENKFKQIDNLLSILLPKFVKILMDQGDFFSLNLM